VKTYGDGGPPYPPAPAGPDQVVVNPAGVGVVAVTFIRRLHLRLLTVSPYRGHAPTTMHPSSGSRQRGPKELAHLHVR
jgi:hypothetical protein